MPKTSDNASKTTFTSGSGELIAAHVGEEQVAVLQGSRGVAERPVDAPLRPHPVGQERVDAGLTGVDHRFAAVLDDPPYGPGRAVADLQLEVDVDPLVLQRRQVRTPDQDVLLENLELDGRR